MRLIIKNGRVIDPAVKQDSLADILIQDGKIVKVMQGMEEAADCQIDARGCFVMPGFIDLHVHLRIFYYTTKRRYLHYGKEEIF